MLLIYFGKIYIQFVFFQYHLETCADRENYYMNKYKIGEEANSLPDMMEHLRIPVQTTSSYEENWDEVSCFYSRWRDSV